MSLLPVENRPIRLLPELAARLEVLLAPYAKQSAQLKAAQAAVLKVYRSGVLLPFDQLVPVYAAAIAAAVKATKPEKVEAAA